MPAVGDRHSVGGSQFGSVGIIAASVPADDFDLRLGFQPTFQRIRRTVWQQIDHTVILQIAQDRSRTLAPPKGPIIHSHDVSIRGGRSGTGADSPQQGIRTARHPQNLGQTASGFSAQSHAQLDLRLIQPFCGSGIRAEARLGAMFDASDEILDDEDLPSPRQWADQAAKSGAAGAGPKSDSSADEAKFPEAVALMRKAESLKSSVEAKDARDVESLCENLRQAMADDDHSAVASLCVELDDILFYVQ